MSKRVRYYIERVHFTDQHGKKMWSRESIAGRKTLRSSRAELRDLEKELPSYFEYRIVRVTTRTEVVE